MRRRSRKTTTRNKKTVTVMTTTEIITEKNEKIKMTLATASAPSWWCIYGGFHKAECRVHGLGRACVTLLSIYPQKKNTKEMSKEGERRRRDGEKRK